MSEEELNKLSNAQLKQKCAEKGIKIAPNAKRQDLINLLLQGEGEMIPEAEEEPEIEPEEEEEPKPKPVIKPKPEAKPAPKPEAKPVPKPEPKKEQKPEVKKVVEEKPKEKKGGKGKEGLKKIEDKMAKVGYIDLYDYMTLGVGIYGLILSLLFFLLPTGFLSTNAINLNSPWFTPNWNDAIGFLFLFIIQIWIYFSLALFPFVIKHIGMKILNKWKSFPLHFIKNEADFQAFIVFLGFWSCTLFSIAAWGLRWPYFISVIVLAIVLLGEMISNKASKKAKFLEKKSKE